VKKRLVSLLLAIVIFVTAGAAGAVTVYAESASETHMTASEDCVELLKQWEGFSLKPYWDYAQYTVGYGSTCPPEMLDYYLANGISEAEAEVLLYNSLNKYEEALHTKLIDKYGLTLSQNQFDALILFSYNCGSGWLYKQQDNLRDALVGGAEENVIVDLFTRWCNAGGQILLPLVRRRLCEANLYLNGVYSKNVPDNYAYVLYDANGGVSKPNIQGYNTELTAQVNPVPTYEGYEFVGWYTERIGGTKVELLDATTKNVRLYAHWVDAEGKTPGENEGAEGTKVTVRADSLNIRKGPGTNYEAAGKLDNGDEVTITETAANGSYIWGKFYGGWIRLDYTDYEAPEAEEEKPAEPAGTVTGTVNVNDSLRIRSGPGTGYRVAGTLGRGDKVEILEQKIVGHMTWGRIEQGWISMDYVILDEKEDDPETTEPTEPETDEPEATEPEATEPPATEPEETQPEATEPPATEPPATEPEVEQKPAVQTGTVKVNDFLRVRTGAGTSYGIAGYLSPNEKVTITETVVVDGVTWGKIGIGWVSLDYVVLDAQSEEAQKPGEDKKEEDKKEEDQTTETEPEDAKPAVLKGIVNVNDFLRVRSGPSTSYAIAGYLKPNDEIEILERKTVGATTWGRTELGWVSMDYIRLEEQEEAAKPEQPEAETPKTQIMTVIADCLRIRGGAGTGNAVVGYLYTGAKVEILETAVVNGDTWGRTSKGWICMDYVV